MKKNKKLIIGIIVILVAALAVILIYPDLFDKKEIENKIESAETEKTADEGFDELQ